MNLVPPILQLSKLVAKQIKQELKFCFATVCTKRFYSLPESPTVFHKRAASDENN